MKLINNRFNVDCKSLTDEQFTFIKMLAGQHPDFNKSQILQLIIDMAMRSTQSKAPASDRANIQDIIHKTVARQIDINANNREYIELGTCENARRIYHDKQNITIEWVQRNVTPKPSLQEINKYIQEHPDVIQYKAKSIYNGINQSIDLFLNKIDKINIGEFNDDFSVSELKGWIAIRRDVQSGNKQNEILLKRQNAMIGRKKVNYFARLEKLCVEEFQFLFEHHKVSTILKTDINLYKNAIQERFGMHPVLLLFKLEPKIRREINSQYSQRVKNREGERALYNVDKYIKTAENLLSSSKYIEIALGLCAMTGRRPGEILATANFTLSDELDIYFEDQGVISLNQGVKFSGQMKTKGSQYARDNYIIPTLCSPKKVIDALHRLRELKDFSGKTPKQVDSSTSKQMGVGAKRNFAEYFEGNVKPYDLRHAYAVITASRYCDNPNQWDKFLSSVLGHSDKDMSTMMSYKTLKIVDN